MFYNKTCIVDKRNDEVTGVQSRAVWRKLCHHHYGKRARLTTRAAWFSTLTTVYLHTLAMNVTGRHWRCRDQQICFFSPFSSYKHWPSFLVCLDTTRKDHALKDHDWNDFVKLLLCANFHGSRCRCYSSASTQGSVVVNFGVVMLGSKTHRLVGPTMAKPSTCMVLLHSLLRGFQRIMWR